jgi:hypothetical protein
MNSISATRYKNLFKHYINNKIAKESTKIKEKFKLKLIVSKLRKNMSILSKILQI